MLLFVVNRSLSLTAFIVNKDSVVFTRCFFQSSAYM